MNTALQTFQFGDVNVAVIDHNQERWMTGEDIGLALEYSEPRKSINTIFDRYRDELEEHSVDIKLMSTDGKQYDTRVYNEEGVMLICFFSKQPKAAAFRKWAVKILKAYRNQELVVKNDYIDELLTTQRQLITSQQDQIAYIKQKSEEAVAKAQDEAKKACYEAKSAISSAQFQIKQLESQVAAERSDFFQMQRSKYPVADAEAVEILAKLYMRNKSVREVAEAHYRSQDAIRKVRKCPPKNLPGPLRDAIFSAQVKH